MAINLSTPPKFPLKIGDKGEIHSEFDFTIGSDVYRIKVGDLVGPWKRSPEAAVEAFRELEKEQTKERLTPAEKCSIVDSLLD